MMHNAVGDAALDMRPLKPVVLDRG